MNYLRLSVAISLLALSQTTWAADPVAELGSFSVFQNVDLAALAKSPKTAHGPQLATPRFLSVQAVYVVKGSPAEHLEALHRWSPVEHRELKVYLQQDVLAGAPESAFAKIKSAPDNGPVRAFVNDTLKMSNDLELSRDEAAQFIAAKASGGLAGSVGDFWMGVMAGRAKAFAGGGSAALAPYNHAGGSVKVNDELKGLLREQEKIRQQFSGFLDGTGIGRGAGSLRPTQYWQLQQIEDTAVAALGAFYARNGGSGAQAADVTYYASGGYYTGLTLYQMWPVTVNGQPSTLVWRGDMTSAASLGSLRGVEKLGSESAMMKNVGRTISLFLQDTAH